MKETDDKTPADRPSGITPAAAAVVPGAAASGTPAPAGPITKLANPGADLPEPAELSLAHVQAMHDRLVRARGELRDLHERMGGLRGDLDGIAKMLRDEVLPQMNDLAGVVDSHADLLNGLDKAIADMGQRVAPLRRGETERRLPAAPAAPGITEAELLEQPGAFEAGKVTDVRGPLVDVTVDPSVVGTTVHQLPSGGELQINVRRAPPVDGAGGGMIRDGRRIVPGGTRRG